MDLFRFIAFLLLVPNFAWADPPQDITGDGIVSYLAFGDSITVGLGDGIPPGAPVSDFEGRQVGPGYPERLTRWAGLLTFNAGLGGEEFVARGVYRFPGVAQASSADIVGILEGSNDAIFRVDSGTYRRQMQRAMNVAFALGKTVILITLPPPCCDRGALSLFTRSFSQTLRDLADVNQVALADVERAWDTTCDTAERCNLLNVPEGLHPNTLGYDVIGQTILASLYGVDLFIEGGAAELESVLGLPAGTVVVKPSAVL